MSLVESAWLNVSNLGRVVSIYHSSPRWMRAVVSMRGCYLENFQNIFVRVWRTASEALALQSFSNRPPSVVSAAAAGTGLT